MFEYYDIEDIVGHRQLPDGKYEYFVKWKGYGTEANTWEPKENFQSPKIIEDYHLSFRTNMLLSNMKKNGNHDSVKVKRTRNYIEITDVLADEEIERHQFEPQKIVNIFHINGDEKLLIAVMQFYNRKDLAFVRATWANANCPQLVIKFYESRIHWREKSTGRMTEASYANNA